MSAEIRLAPLSAEIRLAPLSAEIGLECFVMVAMRAPQRVYDFTDYSRTRPAAQQPGDRLDAQFAEHALSIRSIIDHLRVKESPAWRDELVEMRRRVDEIVQSVEGVAAVARSRGEEAVARVAAALGSAQGAFEAALRSAEALRVQRDEVGVRLEVLAEKLGRAEGRIAGLEAFPVLGPNTGGFYAGDVQGATATSADYAQVSIDWAEHMPDTIPPNTLAINAITGQHWSSRWWATKAAASFGGQMAYLYLGPSPTPPTLTPDGKVIPVGAIYYDTTDDAMYVWNGTAWVPFNTPQKSASSVLFYSATNGQTTFPLTATDMFGNASPPLDANGDQGIEVWLNGARLTPSKGTTVVDFTVDLPSSSVILQEGTQANAVLAVDVLTPAAKFAPANVALVKIVITPDGATTTFPLMDASDNPYHTTNAASLIVTVDGVCQNPGVDYTISGDGNSIVFGTAPAADSRAFAVIAYTGG